MSDFIICHQIIKIHNSKSLCSGKLCKPVHERFCFFEQLPKVVILQFLYIPDDSPLMEHLHELVSSFFLALHCFLHFDHSLDQFNNFNFCLLKELKVEDVSDPIVDSVIQHDVQSGFVLLQ